MRKSFLSVYLAYMCRVILCYYRSVIVLHHFELPTTFNHAKNRLHGKQSLKIEKKKNSKKKYCWLPIKHRFLLCEGILSLYINIIIVIVVMSISMKNQIKIKCCFGNITIIFIQEKSSNDYYYYYDFTKTIVNKCAYSTPSSLALCSFVLLYYEHTNSASNSFDVNTNCTQSLQS